MMSFNMSPNSHLHDDIIVISINYNIHRFLGDIVSGFSVHFPNTQGVTNSGCVISVC